MQENRIHVGAVRGTVLSRARSRVGRRRTTGLLLLCAMLVAGPARAQRIREILVLQNSKTTDETVRFLAGVDEGDEFTPALVDQVRIDLISSGLFKEVQVSSAPVNGGVRLTIWARDKHSWAVAPTYYNQPTNRGGGLGFGENNLLGENKKLLLYAQVATGDSFFVAAYVDPSIRGTILSWQADLLLKRTRVIEYAPPDEFLESPLPVRRTKLNYLNGGLNLGLTLFRSATIRGRLRGAWVSYDETSWDALADTSLLPAEVPDPGTGGWDISTEGMLDIDRRANFYGISSGTRLKLYYSRALPELGSAFAYWYAGAHLTWARRFFDSHNLVLKLGGASGRDLPFQQEFSAGGTDQRGYKNAHFRGDFKMASNIEYSAELFSIKGVSLRALAFHDSSYTAFTAGDAHYASSLQRDYLHNYFPGRAGHGLRNWRNSVGLGTRLFIRQIVIPLLGLDVGYGLEGGDLEVYLAIGLSDT